MPAQASLFPCHALRHSCSKTKVQLLCCWEPCISANSRWKMLPRYVLIYIIILHNYCLDKCSHLNNLFQYNGFLQIVKVLNPNAILVELCRQRVSLLELDDKKFLEDAKNFDAKKLKEAVKGQNFVSGMLHAMLLKTYADIAKELGVAPGGEFRRAYHEMKRIPGCKLFLGDRPIQITIARAFQSLSVYELGQVLYHLTTSNPKPLDKDQLEKYKDRDFVQAQFEEITRDVPAFKKIFHVFVDERDKCLAYSLQECVRSVDEGPRVLAVVGMGHVDGIVKYYGKMRQEDIVPLLLIPREPLARVLIRKGLKLTFYFLLFSFFYRIIFG
ncbi:unnamed protein product [Chrysodeixis includens]|uniref:Uncharacterized protein n=1 Tax=Chrysodeixis includens TaxID=689277 RepID=A0A9P0FXP9_CHRIL|nr:unnamed protein product [Chrysodeixis includens]